MLRILRNNIFLFFLPLYAESSSIPSLEKDRVAIIKEYMKIHREFGRNLCKGGSDEHRFKKLYKNFRGEGHYLPFLPNGRADKKTIRKYIPLIKKKKIWLDDLISGFSKLKPDEIKKDIPKLKEKMKKILHLKYEYSKATQNKKEEIQRKSKIKLMEFNKDLKLFFKRMPFLMSFNHPVDHLNLRREYDGLKERKDYKGKRKSNSVYFLRTVLEDGAQNPDRSKNDKWFRAYIDNIVLNLLKEDILSENMRYDISSAFKEVESFLEMDKSWHLARLNEWKNRIEKKIVFYKKIQLQDKSLARARSIARHELMEFNRKKKEQVYRFWMKKNELMRILFVMETILHNEAGGIDGRDALERKDVAKVIVNRHDIPSYSVLDKEDDVFVGLKKYASDLTKYRWLNLLFKTGEFSFSYYFIPSSVRIYCPSMTRWGRFLRRENLKIALSLLKNPDPNFKAVRYFSRHSMLGRIDMAVLWKDFTPLPERPGLPVFEGRLLKSRYKKGSYDYLYDFTGSGGKVFKVVRMGEKNYVVSGKMKFYHYRNPHFFRYFKKRE